MANKNGYDPLMAESLTRKIVTNYVGIHKIEPRMKRCLEHLQTIRERVLPFVGARTYHELMRALELRGIIDLAEIHTQSALMRNETRLFIFHHQLAVDNVFDDRAAVYLKLDCHPLVAVICF